VKSTLTLLLLTNFLFAQQKDTLINGILFDRGLTFTDSIQMGLIKKETFEKSDTPKAKKRGEDFDLFELFDPDSIANSRICLKFAPLSLLGIYTGPSVRLGVEYKIKNNWSLYNEFGYFLGNRGIITKLELKKYLDEDRNVGLYISGELSYKYQAYDTDDSIQIKPFYNKEYSVTKNVECLTIKFGKLKVKKLGIIVDSFVGAGIRFKQATNTLDENEKSKIKSSSDYGPNIFTNESGFRVYPNIDFGIKIGYRIK
jgi:hypothetical protein